MLCDTDIPPDSHWAIRGICCICSYTISTEYRNVDEKNRDEINALFHTNIESGTICMTCWSEFIRFKRDVLHPWNEESSAFPDLLGFSNHLFPSNILYNNNNTQTPSIQEQPTNNTNNVQTSPTTTRTNKRKTKNTTNNSSKKRTQNTDKQKTKKTKQPSKSAKEKSKKQDSVLQHAEITKAIDHVPNNTPVPAPPPSPPHSSSEFSFLNSLKVKDIVDQLKKLNASTKGSKAQITQRLVRYMCLFSNPQPMQPVLYDTNIPPQHANTLPVHPLQNHVSIDLAMVPPSIPKPMPVIYNAQMQPNMLNREATMQIQPDAMSSVSNNTRA